MTDPQRDLALAVAIFLALCALAIACALWWRVNQMTRPAEPEQPATAERPALPPVPPPAKPSPVEPPTTPIEDAVDQALARFDFHGGRRP